MFEVEDKNLAIANLAGIGRFFDGLNGGVELFGGNRDFNFYLGQEVDNIFSASIKLGVPLLAAEALDLGDGQSVDAHGGKGFADFIELEWLDDRGYEFHGWTP